MIIAAVVYFYTGHGWFFESLLSRMIIDRFKAVRQSFGVLCRRFDPKFYGQRADQDVLLRRSLKVRPIRLDFVMPNLASGFSFVE